MKVKFTFLMAAFLLSGLMNMFAQTTANVDFTTVQGYVDGDLSTLTPTDGVVWTANASHFLVDATAGKVSIPDASSWQRAKYNRAFASGTTTFTLAKKFSFYRSLDAYSGNHPIMGFYLQHASNNLYFDFTFNRSGATNYGLGYFINAPEVISAERWRNTGGITPAALGFLDAEDTSSDELTLELTLTKGIDADSWTAVGKVLNGSTEVFSWDFGGTPFKVGATFHNSTELYGGLSVREGMANSKISNRTITTFKVSPMAPLVTTGHNILGAEAAFIHPTLVEDILNVSSSDVKKIEIFNLSGKLVKSVQLNGSQVDVSELAKGVYVVRLIGSTTAMSKFVKK